MRYLLIVYVSALLSCVATNKQGSIIIENKSDQFIDSIAIHANDTIFKFYKISAGASVEASVLSGKVKGGHHIKITPTLYTGGRAVECSYFYDDLGGFRGDYKMTISKEINVKWSWKAE